MASVGILVSLALNVLLFLFAFRILTAADISWSDAALGALVGAVAWTTFEAVGGYYVGHQLRRVLLDQTRDYVVAFDAAVAQCSSKEELVERITARYGDRALPMILDIAAGTAFPGEL